MSTKNLLIYVQLGLGMAIFGSGTPVSKIVTDGFPPLLASGARMLVAGLLLLPFIWHKRDRLRKLERRDYFVLGGVALVGMFIFSVTMLYGMKEVSGVIGSIIMSTTPVVTAAGAFLFLGNELGWRRIAAVVLALIGVLVLQVSSAGDSSSGGNILLGSLLVFGAVCSEATYTLLGRVASKQLEPVLLAGIAAWLAVVLFVVPAAVQAQDFDMSAVDAGEWLALLWWGGGTMTLGSVLWYSGVKQVAGSTAAGFMGVMPVSALVLSYVLLGEAFQPVHLLGFGIVFAGVLLIIWSHVRSSRQAAEEE